MLLNWNHEGPLSIGHRGMKEGIHKNMPVFTICIPGVNHLPDNIWEENKTDATYKKWIKEGKLRIITEKDPTKAIMEKNKESAPELAGLELTDAVEVVGDCLNKPLLESWKKVDHRQQIQYAISEQLDKLKIDTKKK